MSVPVAGSIDGAVVNVSPPVVPVGVRLNVSVCGASSGGPKLMAAAVFATGRARESSLTAGGAASVKLGASFTAFTVIVKVCTPLVLLLGNTLDPLSLSVTSSVAVPWEFAATS